MLLLPARVWGRGFSVAKTTPLSAVATGPAFAYKRVATEYGQIASINLRLNAQLQWLKGLYCL